MQKLKKRLSPALVAVMLLLSAILGTVAKIDSAHAALFTKQEAIDACEKMNTSKRSISGNTLTCYLHNPDQSDCSKNGGTFTGGPDSNGDYFCVIGFDASTAGDDSGGSTNDSGKSVSDIIEEKRAECKAKDPDATFNVNYTNGKTVTTTCSADAAPKYTSLSNDSEGDSSDGGSSYGPGKVSVGDASKKAQAAILTGCANAEAGGGEGIKCVVLTAVNILSVLVGIAGIIGIVLVGIQYLTASGNEEQTRKAKRRLFEIVIGIIAYALMAALLNWLLPGYNTSNSTSINDTSEVASKS